MNQIAFDTPDLFDRLQAASAEQLDQIPFGVVRLNPALEVVAYNRRESELSGLSPGLVLGKPFFTDVAPCTNNAMVAHRYNTDGDLDVMVDYVLAFFMRPTKATLRLMRRHDAAWSYFCVRPT